MRRTFFFLLLLCYAIARCRCRRPFIPFSIIHFFLPNREIKENQRKYDAVPKHFSAFNADMLANVKEQTGVFFYICI